MLDWRKSFGLNPQFFGVASNPHIQQGLHMIENNYGNCPVCGGTITIPGLDRSYCSNCRKWQIAEASVKPENLSKPKKSIVYRLPQSQLSLDWQGGVQ
jgi:hypothetical protein